MKNTHCVLLSYFSLYSIPIKLIWFILSLLTTNGNESPRVTGIIFLGIAFFRTFLIKERVMWHRCDSRIINYLTLMTLKTLEMTGTKSKFRSKFWLRLDSVPVTGRNFSGIKHYTTNLFSMTSHIYVRLFGKKSAQESTIHGKYNCRW